MNSGINPGVLLQNLGYLADIFEALSILIGLFIFMAGIFRLKRYGESRTYMSQQMTIAGPLIMLISGTALMMLPTMLHTALLNFWSSSNPMHYTGYSNHSWEELIPPIIVFVRLIGVGAFIRGIVLFSRTGSEGSQHGSMSKAMLHLLGGILCVNIVGTWKLLQSILGIT